MKYKLGVQADLGRVHLQLIRVETNNSMHFDGSVSPGDARALAAWLVDQADEADRAPEDGSPIGRVFAVDGSP